jgi:tetratricopeptide (TPR) repeat protein
MTGNIVTFYSYKGGVGRTLVLANTAVKLAQWGYRVLCIDWDLDAPGLGFYFKNLQKEPVKRGLIDLINDFKCGNESNSHDYIVPIRLPNQRGQLDFMAAGVGDDEYVRSLQKLEWTTLYSSDGLGDYLESCRVDWKTEYDFTLIDSRTGITDIGGICTVQLPDLLVMLFTANEQSLAGSLDVARRAARAHNALPYDRAGLMILPILTRFDSREEYERAAKWQRRLASELQPMMDTWAPREVSVSRILNHLTIPYVSYWSFGEDIPAIIEPEPSPDQISYALDPIAAIIAHRLTRTEMLTENRDSYIEAAQRSGLRSRSEIFDVFISHDPSTYPLALDIADELAHRQIQVTPLQDPKPATDVRQYRDALTKARHMITLIGSRFDKFQLAEVNSFLKQSLDDENSNRQIFPIITPDARSGEVPRIISSLQSVKLSDTSSRSVREAVERIAETIKIISVENTVSQTERTLGPDHPDTIMARNNLADAYLSAGRLEPAIALMERTLQDHEQLFAPDDPKTVALRYSLAGAYVSAGRLESAIALFERTLGDCERLFGAEHPNTLSVRHHLAGAYLSAGRVDAAIDLSEQALAFTSASDRSRPSYLSTLGTALLVRFERTGSTADLERAITVLDDAVAAAPSDQPGRAWLLNNLGHAFSSRFQRADNAADLDRAIAVFEEAISATSADDASRARYLTNLGMALKIRFERTGNTVDLERAITVFEKAISATSADDADRVGYLTNLGTALKIRFESTGNTVDLERTIAVFEEALAATVADHPYRGRSLLNLGSALSMRYERTGDEADLNRAVDVLEQAVAATPATHPDRTISEANLEKARRSAAHLKESRYTNPASS